MNVVSFDLKEGTVRRDPFAMLPFCGYHMGDYFAHWIKMGAKSDADKLPKIFYVNWFRKSADGSWLWPGYGENSRVLKWVFDRCEGTGNAIETPLGYMPETGDIDLTGLESEVSEDAMEELMKVDREGWLKEVEGIKEHYARFGDRLPTELADQLKALEGRLKK